MGNKRKLDEEDLKKHGLKVLDNSWGYIRMKVDMACPECSEKIPVQVEKIGYGDKAQQITSYICKFCNYSVHPIRVKDDILLLHPHQ